MMRKLSIWYDLAKLILFFVALWLAFVYLAPYVSSLWPDSITFSKQSFEISTEQEEKLGKFIINQSGFEDVRPYNSTVDSALKLIESRLLDQIDTPQFNYNIILVSDPMMNAMTFPGGNIVLFEGVIAHSESPNEVAAVLAHEIGHAENRHVVSKLITELGLTVVLAVVTGGDATIINELMRLVLSTVFSREQEREADLYALQLLEDAGVPPISLAAFFERIQTEEINLPEAMEWVTTHPSSEERIQTAQAFRTGADFIPVDFNMDWSKIKAAL